MSLKPFNIFILLTFILAISACEKNESDIISPKYSSYSLDESSKNKQNNKSRSYPIPIFIDTTQANFLEVAFSQIDTTTEVIITTYDEVGNAVNHIVAEQDFPKPPTGDPELSIDCDSGDDPDCVSNWRAVYKHNINNGLCHTYGWKGTHHWVHEYPCP